jgi:hypothetical protein
VTAEDRAWDLFAEALDAGSGAAARVPNGAVILAVDAPGREVLIRRYHYEGRVVVLVDQLSAGITASEGARTLASVSGQPLADHSLPHSRSRPSVKGGPSGPSEASREAAPLTAGPRRLPPALYTRAVT